MLLSSLDDNFRAIIIGANGGIGRAISAILANDPQCAQIHALSRGRKSADISALQHPKITHIGCDFTDKQSLNDAQTRLKTEQDSHGGFDIIIIATGLLHTDVISPEKNLRALDYDAFAQSFSVNTIGPALCAQAFLPLLRRDRKAVFTALSARVSSISDNRLGGWYAYRSAKAALNMVLKNLAIEYGRRFSNIIIAGLHPGTVDTTLSQPFQKNLPEGQLFTPQYSAEKLLGVINDLGPNDSGYLFAWDGQKIPF